MSGQLLLINGYPATGKSTLQQKLAKDLQISAIGKDAIKEFLADELTLSGVEGSQIAGLTASKVLYLLAEEYLSHRRPLILENAFIAEFAGPALADILQKHHASCLEVYCRTDSAERLRRFSTRHVGVERHNIHVDQKSHLKADEAELAVKYSPLDLGQLIEVDTTHFDEADYGVLLEEIKDWLE